MNLDEMKKSVNTYVDDAEITTKVKGKLAADDLFKSLNIHVKTNQGVVTLTGEVPDTLTLDKAKELTEKTNGVKSVMTNLDIAD